MTKPVDELRATVARLKRETDELLRKIEALSTGDAGSLGARIQFTEEQVMRVAQRAVDLYVMRHQRPSQVTMTQAAEMLGLSRYTVRNLMKAGKLSFNGCGLIPIEQVDRVLAIPSR